MKTVILALSIAGAGAGFVSAHWWRLAAKVPPVYNTAMLSGSAEEAQRIDSVAALNARAAAAAALAVACQSLILLIPLLCDFLG